MPRPESYRKVERCCATCEFVTYISSARFLCGFGEEPITAQRLGDVLIEPQGICDEYQPEPSPEDEPCDA